MDAVFDQQGCDFSHVQSSATISVEFGKHGINDCVRLHLRSGLVVVLVHVLGDPFLEPFFKPFSLQSQFRDGISRGVAVLLIIFLLYLSLFGILDGYGFIIYSFFW